VPVDQRRRPQVDRRCRPPVGHRSTGCRPAASTAGRVAVSQRSTGGRPLVARWSTGGRPLRRRRPPVERRSIGRGPAIDRLPPSDREAVGRQSIANRPGIDSYSVSRYRSTGGRCPVDRLRASAACPEGWGDEAGNGSCDVAVGRRPRGATGLQIVISHDNYLFSSRALLYKQQSHPDTKS